MNEIIRMTHLRLWRGKQGLFGECIARTSSHRYTFRGFIERDSYDNQCKWKGEMWTQSGWSYVLSLSPNESRLFEFSAYRAGEDWKVAAKHDLSHIVREAMFAFGESPRNENQ